MNVFEILQNKTTYDLNIAFLRTLLLSDGIYNGQCK